MGDALLLALGEKVTEPEGLSLRDTVPLLLALWLGEPEEEALSVIEGLPEELTVTVTEGEPLELDEPEGERDTE